MSCLLTSKFQPHFADPIFFNQKPRNFPFEEKGSNLLYQAMFFASESQQNIFQNSCELMTARQKVWQNKGVFSDEAALSTWSLHAEVKV